MSIDYSIFIKGKTPTSVIKPALEEILNCELTRVELREQDELYAVELLGVSVQLWATWTYDDDVIKFSECSHEIAIDYQYGSFYRDYKEDWERMMCIVIASMLTNALSCESIVVEDVQKVIESFSPETLK